MHRRRCVLLALSAGIADVASLSRVTPVTKWAPTLSRGCTRCCHAVPVRAAALRRRPPSQLKAEAQKQAQDDPHKRIEKSADEVGVIDLLKFVLPTLGIWLAGPVMSLIDTSVVGLRSSLELAALGPAQAVTDSLIYSFSFLAVATTNLLATALAGNDEAEAQRVVSHALAIAVAFGAAVLVGVQVFGPTLIGMASGGRSPELLGPALVYARWRILSVPACLGGMVAQAALLGAKDSLTPLTVVIVAGLLNAVGDVLLACLLGWGIAGAAIATAASELVSLFLLARALRRMQGARQYPFIKLPPPAALRRFFAFAGPIFFSLLGKVVSYNAMTNAAACSGNIELAAHNVMLRIFFLFTCVGDSLSQTAQAFLPGMMARDKETERRAVAAAATAAAASGVREVPVKGWRRRLLARPRPSSGNKLIRKILLMAVVVGTLNATFAGLLPQRLPQLFTRDALIIREMKGLAPLLCWSLLSQAMVMCCEGVLLAKRELSFLAGTYAVNTMALLAFMRNVKTWGGHRGLHGVWYGLLTFQLLRFFQFGARVLWVKRGERRGARAARKEAYDAAFQEAAAAAAAAGEAAGAAAQLPAAA